MKKRNFVLTFTTSEFGGDVDAQPANTNRKVATNSAAVARQRSQLRISSRIDPKPFDPRRALSSLFAI